MWFEKYDIIYKKKGLEIEIPFDYYTKPYTKEKFQSYCEHAKDFHKSYDEISIPKFLKLPQEYVELLRFSNGGTIVNKEREFGFFDMETIREFYICYGFIVDEPNMLPIAFNGGGTFYTYKFVSEDKKPKIYGVHMSCIGFKEDTCFLGNTLDEVLTKETDIDDEIYQYKIDNGIIKIHKVSEEEQQRIDLEKQLTQLEEDRSLGKIDLKAYLKTKRAIKNKIYEIKKLI